MDYRRYGGSTGEPSEAAFKEDALNVYEVITEKRPEVPIVIWGRSFGSGVAASVAAAKTVKKPKMLVLETPYCSLVDLVRQTHPYLPPGIFRYELPTHEFLKSANCPIHLIHGTQDEKIPFNSSERLKVVDQEKVAVCHVFSRGTRRCFLLDDDPARGRTLIIARSGSEPQLVGRWKVPGLLRVSLRGTKRASGLPRETGEGLALGLAVALVVKTGTRSQTAVSVAVAQAFWLDGSRQRVSHETGTGRGSAVGSARQATGRRSLGRTDGATAQL